MEMFQVKSKYVKDTNFNFVRTVYAVKSNMYGEPLFLVYVDETWHWINAGDYEPV